MTSSRKPDDLNRLKVVMGPVNIAGQPYQLVQGLRAKGVDARLIQQQFKDDHPFKYSGDERVIIDSRHRLRDRCDMVRRCLDEAFDIFHFWQRSFVWGRPYAECMGFDLPLYGQYGRRVVYRFTGFDLRTKTEHIARNPYHPWRYGYDLAYDEEAQRRYIDFVRENADLLVVQDPEMHEFCPEAAVIPRALDLNEFSYVGVERTDMPLVVHAPSKEAVKGTGFVRKAVQTLREEGLTFEYREIIGLPNNEAVALYKQADIIIDQLHIGWYGVLAVEAMALGKPVICYVRDDLAPPDLPIVRANPDTITSVLRKVIEDSDLRLEASPAGRAYVERVHDVNKVTDALLAAYMKLPAPTPQVRDSYPTLDYLRNQLCKNEDEIRFARFEAASLRRQLQENPLNRVRARLATMKKFLLNMWQRGRGQLVRESRP